MIMPSRLLAFFPKPTGLKQWSGSILILTLAVAIGLLSARLYWKERLKEQQLREWKYWSKLSQDSSSAMVVVDGDTGEITGWNSAATELLGWTAEEVKGQVFTFLVPKRYIASKYHSMDSYLEAVLDARQYDTLSISVRVIRDCAVNTKSGKQIKCFIAIRAVANQVDEKGNYDGYSLIATINSEETVEVIRPMSPH